MSNGDTRANLQLARNADWKIARKGEGEGTMQSFHANHVDEGRAASLLGLSAAQLRQLSDQTGAGYVEDGSGHRVFTYAELYRMCRLAVQVRAS